MLSLSAERADVARVYRQDTEKRGCLNIFAQSLISPIAGQVFPDCEEISPLNQELSAGFEPELVNDLTPKFVVGEIVENG